MADFALILAAMDEAIGTTALPYYMAQGGRIAQDVVEGDTVAMAIVEFIDDGPWEGTASELLARIRPEKVTRDFPDSPRAMAARLRKLIPDLRGRRRAAAMGVRARTYVFPPLAECRLAFEQEFGQEIDWPEEISPPVTVGVTADPDDEIPF